MPAPNAPSNLTATTQPNAVVQGTTNTGKIKLDWQHDGQNVTGFKIERCEGAGCANFAQVAQVGASARSYSNIGLKNRTMFRYRVRAYQSTAGNSGYSNEAEAQTL